MWIEPQIGVATSSGCRPSTARSAMLTGKSFIASSGSTDSLPSLYKTTPLKDDVRVQPIGTSHPRHARARL